MELPLELFRWLTRGLNRLIMLPWFRFGRGPRPTRLGGSILVLRTRGRRTGQIRDVPLNYAPAGDGALWIAAGFGNRTGWLHNLRAEPLVRLNLGGAWSDAHAAEVSDPTEWLAAIRALLRHAGFMGYIYGFNPDSVSDRRLRRACRGLTVFRVERRPPSAAPASGVAA